MWIHLGDRLAPLQSLTATDAVPWQLLTGIPRLLPIPLCARGLWNFWQEVTRFEDSQANPIPIDPPPTSPMDIGYYNPVDWWTSRILTQNTTQQERVAHSHESRLEVLPSGLQAASGEGCGVDWCMHGTGSGEPWTSRGISSLEKVVPPRVHEVT